MARARLGFWPRFAVAIVLPVLKVFTRPTWRGQQHVPAGGKILVANHISHFDPLVIAHFVVYGIDSWPRYLAKASLWKVPVLGPFLHRVHQIPVERGSVEAVKSLDALVDALQQGGTVVIYPEGTTTKEPDLWPMRGKTGAARLALATGAPVIPVANWGAQDIFDPRTKKIRFRPRTPVSVIAGPPVDLGKWLGEAPSRPVLEEMTEQIMLSIRSLVGEVREGEPPPLYQSSGRSVTPPVTPPVAPPPVTPPVAPPPVTPPPVVPPSGSSSTPPGVAE